MDIEALKIELETLVQAQDIHDPVKIAARERVLDLIHFIDQVAQVHSKGPQGDEVVALHRRALHLRESLKAINAEIVTGLRSEILTGLRGPALRALLNPYTDYIPRQPGQDHYDYDGLDSVLHDLLDIHTPPPALKTQTAEMVHYEPTPSRVILDLVDHLPLTKDDIFYDIGAGLGHIAILINLLAEIEVVGVEYEPAYCDHATTIAAELGLSRITFVNADARTADYNRGTVFFMFTPFVGQMFKTVLARLREKARQRPIILATFGPCTLEIEREGWLYHLDENDNHIYRLAVFQSR